ncbi:MAG: hypothetical protein QM765_26150 [Myxococcales bacterium]
MKQQLLPGLALAAAVIASGCFAPVTLTELDAAVSDDGSQGCEPGSTLSCRCTGGGPGAQVCGDDGRFGDCACLEPCVPGRSEACVCGDGRRGARLCGDEGYFGVCTCVGPGRDAGATPRVDAGQPWRSDASVTPQGRDASQPSGPDASRFDPDAGIFATGTVSLGTDTLIDFFPVPSGLIVVRKTGIDLLDGANTLMATVSSPREITAAGFDGTLLAVADKAMLSVYDVSLSVLRTVMLTESCASAVVVSGARFVCGPSNDWDRVFSIYDLTTGAKLATSSPRTYEGTPMRRVPGTDDFITVTTNLSPSDFYLHRVGSDHTLAFYGDSPYHGDFAATMAFAFDGAPPEHLIQSDGIFLEIYTQGCVANSGWQTGGCFIRDGELGTLGGDEWFVAMADDGAGTLWALVTSGSYWDGVCEKGCKAQRIDIAQRLVVGETNVVFANPGKILGAKWDPYGHRFLMGYLVSEGYSSWDYKGYELRAEAP